MGVDYMGPSGAGVWTTPIVDTRRRALYFGTGNSFSEPATTSHSIMALDMDTGKILWWKQARAKRYLAWRLHADDSGQSGAWRLSIALPPAALSERQLRG
jgi:hypothetical protein